MISSKDVQVYTPTVEEYAQYYSHKNKIGSGYWTFLASSGKQEDKLATVSKNPGEIDLDGESANHKKGGHTPSVKLNRESQFFQSSKVLEDLHPGMEFKLDVASLGTEGNNVDFTGLPVVYRVELVDDKAVTCRPKRPLCIGMLRTGEKFDRKTNFGTEVNERLLKELISIFNGHLKEKGDISLLLVDSKPSEKMIRFSRPVLKELEDKVRMQVEATIGGGEKEILYYEVSKEYKDYLCYERSDAFVIAALPWAIRAGYDIVCEAPVTEALLYHIQEDLLPILANYDPATHAIKIIASTDATPIEGKEVGTGISLGVDSFYAVKTQLETEYEAFRLSQLLYTSSKGAPSESQIGHESEVRQRDAQQAADFLNLPLVFIFTNSRMIFPLGHARGNTYTNMSAVLALRKLFKAYYCATGYDISLFKIIKSSKRDTDRYLPLIMSALSTPGLSFYMSGASTSRQEKVREIADWEVVQKYLRVCLSNTKNCGKTYKCRRTLLNLDYVGRLEQFRESFDIDYYLENRAWYYKEFITDPNNLFLRSMSKHFWEKEPELMRQASELAKPELEIAKREKRKKKMEKNQKRVKGKIKKMLGQ